MRRPNVLGWGFVVLLAVLAEIAIASLELHDSVAAPSDTLRALVDGLSSGELTDDLATTLSSYAQGLAIAIVLGVGFGVLIGSSRTMLDASFVLLEFLRPIPAVALIPAAILVFDLGVETSRFVVAYAAVWPILVYTLYGVRGSDRLLHDVARTSGVTPAGRLFRVALPSALPSITTGIRLSASIGLVVCVTAEYLMKTGGIGTYMQEHETARLVPELYSAILLTALLGYTINRVLGATERRTVFWAGEERIAWR